MAIKLSDYQLDAIHKLKNGNILVGGVGSGKSRTSIAYFYICVCNGGLKINGSGFNRKPANPMDLYIITTAKKRDSKEWEGELAPFGLSTEYENNDIHVTVDSWQNVKKYIGVSDSFFIFDEDKVCGYGVWSKSFIKITKKNKWILATATPGDKWEDYIPVFIANGFYSNITEFRRKHCIYSYWSNFPKIEKYIGTAELLKHRNDIIVEMKYKRPAITHHIDILVDYDREEYKNLMRLRWNAYENKPVENISELCFLMRKITNSNESRVIALNDILLEHNKIIVFYNHDYELDILKKNAEALGIPYSEWNGHKHEPIPSTESWIYLVNYMSAAEGWNCIETDTMIFFSQNYSYKTMVQAAGRIDRMNTPFKDLYYYHFKSKSSIDIAISKALKEKKTFNESRFFSE
jgi:hypothetical protein